MNRKPAGEITSETALETFESPHPIWIPIRFGPFWYRSRQESEWHLPVPPSTDEYLEHLLVGPGVTEAELDGYQGAFDLLYETEELPNSVYPFDVLPIDLPSTLHDGEIKERIHLVWSIMQEEFRKAVDREQCILHARADSPLSNFRSISPDIFQYFEVINWMTGLARSQSGHLLYSLHVAPAVSQNDPLFDTDPSEERVTTVARRKPRAPKLENAIAAVEWVRQSRSTLDDLTDKELGNAVADRMRSLGQRVPSLETIRRAAGRRKVD